MPIEESPFSEQIYTRRDKFNHEYDITLNEITTNSNKKGFSNSGYCYSLLKRVNDLSHHEKILFLRYQLNKSSKPMRWLLDFEKLIEINSWESAQEFYNQFENLSIKTKEIIRDLFKAIETGKYKNTSTEVKEFNNNNVIYNTTEACEFLNISKSTIYKLTSARNIPFYKPNGKNMYFKKDELVAYLSKKRQITNSELETQTSAYLNRNHRL
ncbi:helix-turn-helix domain-containing protein [Bizionia sp.]|uniref:helix-turn-helix domain-containing protein n=1 Tax=Bizionia sp. TaxID=1954480 RepID=UPI003A8F1373